MEIRRYNPWDEKGWVRCRVLSFLDTAYFDNVLREKETYDNPSIELVAVLDDQIAGLMDIEYELKERQFCSRGTGLGGMIWHIAVHPDFQRNGIAVKLLQEAEKIASELELDYLEAWTRDDKWVNRWYEKNGFENMHSYLHVYIEGHDEHEGILGTEMAGLRLMKTFAHYTGPDKEKVRSRFNRVHDCICYVKNVGDK
jgi:ribosomal protein S18 acetylase RimI-like enzyme